MNCKFEYTFLYFPVDVIYYIIPYYIFYIYSGESEQGQILQTKIPKVIRIVILPENFLEK